MDEIITEFLEETNESLGLLDQEILDLEKDPNNKEILSNVFRVMHTIKGTCGFLGLPRLESVAHASENVLGKIRDGEITADQSTVSLILESIDRIKEIVAAIEETGAESEGDDTELKDRLNKLAEEGPGGSGELEVAGGDATQPVDDGGAANEVSDEAATTEKAANISVESGANDTNTNDTNKEGDDKKSEESGGQDKSGSDGQAALVASGEVGSDKEDISPEAKSEAINQGLKAAEKDNKAADDKQPQQAKANKAGQSIRINLDILENLMQMAGELVLVRNQLMQIARTAKESEFYVPLQKLSHITSDLQEGVMKTRMQPVGNAWNKFPRLVRDLSIELGKKVELKMEGEDTEMDRQLLDMVRDPLTHMVRNSVDHGLESPEDRKATGKNEVGTVNLSASHESGHIIIKITDDGKGIDSEKIKQKAIQNGLTTEHEAASLSDSQIYQFLFKPGFSTAEKVTSVSGRGVGMDVVKTNIEKIGGTIELDSELGKGSVFTVKIPLTLAILSVLILEIDGNSYAIPQIRVTEVVRAGDFGEGLDEAEIESLNGSPVMRLRGKLLSLISLTKALEITQADEADLKKQNNIIVCQVGSQSFGVIVDKVLHTEEIVVKPVSAALKNIDVYAGNTILGDGSVIMILDVNGIMKRIGNVSLDGNEVTEGEGVDNTEEEQVTFLLFKDWSKSHKCVPLELVSRVEEIDLSKTESSVNYPVVQYRGDLMRLVTLNPSNPLPEDGMHKVIVFADEDKLMGLVVEDILDIVEHDISSRVVAGEGGFLGSVIINGHTTDIIDISYLFSSNFKDWMSDKTELSGGEQVARKKLLLVDDSPFFRKFMKPILMSHDFLVSTSDSGKKALEMLADRSFDVVVTDIDMPEMNGMELVKKIKTDDRFVNMPVIALTSYTSDDFVSNIDQFGFDGYISKSNRESISSKIGELLG